MFLSDARFAPARVLAGAIAWLVLVASSTLAAPVHDDAQGVLQALRDRPDARLLDQAKSLIATAVTQHAADSRTWTLKAWVESIEHRFAVAQGSLQTAAQLGAGDAIFFGLRADVATELGDYPDAVSVTDELLERFPGAPALTRAAHLRYLHGDLPGAIDAATAALRSARHDLQARQWILLQLAELHYSAGDFDAAEKAIAALREPSAAAKAALARIRIAQQRIEEARGLLEEASHAAFQPETVWAELQLATASGHMKRARKAEKLLAVMAQTDQGMSRRTFAAFAASRGDPGRALQLAREEYAARPDIYSAAVLATAAMAAGDAATALNAAREALRLNTPDPDLQLGLAAVLRKAGAIDQASQIERRFAQTHPGLLANLTARVTR